jgi:hypothetical protein
LFLLVLPGTETPIGADLELVVQRLNVPSQVWALCPLPNGDLLVGTESGAMYIFTRYA